jgi:putative oxidoreductase
MAAALGRVFVSRSPLLADVTVLLMRVAFGGMIALGHGRVKLLDFNKIAAAGFPDPLGVGVKASLVGAIFGELVCGILLVVGLLTRLAALQLVFTFAVAALLVHGSGPLFMPAENAKEPALVYMLIFAALALLGPGRFSLDAVVFRGRRKA